MRKVEMQSSLKPSVWLKILLVLVFGVAIGMAVWLFLLAFSTSMPQPWPYYATSAGILLIVALAGKQSIERCSVTLTESGLEQLSLFTGGRLYIKKKLRWSEIEGIAAKPGAYMFNGKSYSIELHTMVFGNHSGVDEFVRAKCPQPIKGPE